MRLERQKHALRVGTVVVIALGGVPASPITRPAAPRSVLGVGANVHVSAQHGLDTHYEVVVAAHPRDPSQLVIGSIIYPESTATYGTIAYRSSDGGASWTSTLGLPALDRTGDPAVAFGPDGTAYFVASSLPAAGERRLLLFRSPDGGAKWDGPFPLTYMDREYVTVDASAGANRGRVYVNGNNRVPRTISDFVLFGSSDGGRSFRGPGTRLSFGTVQASVMGNAVVASDGTVIGVYVAGQRASIEATWSVDGGASLAPGAKIDDYIAGGERKGAVLGNANAEPALAIDATGGRFKDRLYVVWPDRRSGHSKIRFASSSDAGRTWSTSRVINDNEPNDSTDQFMPEVAVNGDGVVGVMWYDRRSHPDNLGWDVRFTASADGGASFLPSVRVSERGASFAPGTSRSRPSPANQRSVESAERAQINAGRDSFMFMGGDTAGLAADAAGIFHLVWIDNRTGTPQVWTAPVTVR
jgi:hypothetical protein